MEFLESRGERVGETRDGSRRQVLVFRFEVKAMYSASQVFGKQAHTSRNAWEAKTPGSASVIAVDPEVLKRIRRLKTLTVDVRAGRSIRHHQVVKSSGPDDLVFQALSDCLKPMNDGNIMRRFVRPAAKKLGLKVNWQILRRSCGTWMVRSKADPKSVQAQMRHSRISTTMDIYAQFASEGQLEAVQQLRNYVEKFVPIDVPIESQNLENGFQNQLASN